MSKCMLVEILFQLCFRLTNILFKQQVYYMLLLERAVPFTKGVARGHKIVFNFPFPSIYP